MSNWARSFEVVLVKRKQKLRMTLWFGASTTGKSWYLFVIETEMLGEKQFWVGSVVSPYVHHGVLR